MGSPLLRRSEQPLRGAHGHTLQRRSWLPSAPERVVLLVHGYGEHSARYEHVGTWLAERGCAVHAYDHQGHGRSSGTRCHVRRFSDYLDDLGRVLQQVQAEQAGLPTFLVGHSMGGLIVTLFGRERAPRLAGVATSGAALALGDGIPRGRLLAARLVRRFLPRLSVASGIDPVGLSRDPAVVEAYRSDPLVESKMTVSLAAELLQAIERVGTGAAEPGLPMLLLHGEADPICPAAASRDFHAGLRSQGCALRLYAGLRHEIFNEPEWETVLGDLLAWLRERTGSAKGPGA